MKSTYLLMLALLVAIGLAACAQPANRIETLPEMQAAQKALQQAESEGAATLCATEYQAAKDKLRQAELLFQDGQVDGARNAAEEAIDLANMARKCAIARRSPVPPPPPPSAKPHLMPGADFIGMKHSVYFDYNSNVLSAAEREKLDAVVEKIGKMSKNFKFFILLAAYCDAPGSPEENLTLSLRRALVVRYYLTRPETGIDPNRVLIAPFGNGPATSEGSATGQNREWRRVDIRISMDVPEEVLQQQQENQNR